MGFTEEAPHAPSCPSFQRKPIARRVREFRYLGSPSTKIARFAFDHLEKTKDLRRHWCRRCHQCSYNTPKAGHSCLPLAVRMPQLWLGCQLRVGASKVAALPLTASAHSSRASLLSPHCASARTTTSRRAPPFTRTGPSPRTVFLATGIEGRVASLWLGVGHVLHVYFLSHVQRLLLKLIPSSVSLSIGFKRATVQHSRSSALHKVRHRPHLTMGGLHVRQSLAWHL